MYVCAVEEAKSAVPARNGDVTAGISLVTGRQPLPSVPRWWQMGPNDRRGFRPATPRPDNSLFLHGETTLAAICGAEIWTCIFFLVLVLVKGLGKSQWTYIVGLVTESVAKEIHIHQKMTSVYGWRHGIVVCRNLTSNDGKCKVMYMYIGMKYIYFV